MVVQSKKKKKIQNMVNRRHGVYKHIESFAGSVRVSIAERTPVSVI